MLSELIIGILLKYGWDIIGNYIESVKLELRQNEGTVETVIKVKLSLFWTKYHVMKTRSFINLSITTCRRKEPG
jgi:hypothetical protein